MITNTFKSKFDSTCSKCHKPINTGDELIREDSGRFVHSDCSSAMEVEEMCKCMPDYCPCKHKDVGCRYNAYLSDGIDRPKGPADDEIDLGLGYTDYYKPEVVKKVVDLFKAGKKVYLPVLGIPMRCDYFPYNCCCHKDICNKYQEHFNSER